MKDTLLAAGGLARLSMAAWVVGPDGVITYASSAFDDLLGVAPGALVGRPRAEVVLAADGGMALLGGPSLIADRLPVRVWLLESDVPGGGRLGVAAPCDTFTRARDEAIAALSHELRTPLSTCVFQLEDMQRAARVAGPGPAQTAQALAVLGRQVDRLRRLVSDLIAVARLEPLAGQRRVAAPLDVARLTRDVAAAFDAEARAEGVSIEVDAEGPVVGPWRAEEVESAVGNLVQNAIRHARSPRVAVSARGDADGGALVEVRDWGVGVPEGERERIFGLFERAEGAGRGLGMGLWIARRAAQSLGGAVRVEPAQGGGAVFSVWLPRPRAAPPG